MKDFKLFKCRSVMFIMLSDRSHHPLDRIRMSTVGIVDAFGVTIPVQIAFCGTMKVRLIDILAKLLHQFRGTGFGLHHYSAFPKGRRGSEYVSRDGYYLTPAGDLEARLSKNWHSKAGMVSKMTIEENPAASNECPRCQLKGWWATV